MLVVAVGLSAYFAPSIVALARHHHNVGTIVVINLLLGWTFIGWVVALAMAAGSVRPPFDPYGQAPPQMHYGQRPQMPGPSASRMLQELRPSDQELPVGWPPPAS